MNILFTEISSGKSNISYILSTDDKKEIGTAEGYIAKEDLIFVIHINENIRIKALVTKHLERFMMNLKNKIRFLI